MRIRVRTVLVSAAVGVVLAALPAIGEPPGLPCNQSAPGPPAPPSPCSKPADGCSNPTETGQWTKYCCKNTGVSDCYWVEYRTACCNNVWKFQYRDGTAAASSCDTDQTCL